MMRALTFLPPAIFLGTTQAFSLSQLIKINTTTVKNNVTQQNLAASPPFPILEIGLEHIMGQWGANATAAENATLPMVKSSKFAMLKNLDAPAQCSPSSPCADASCCNSEGKCGFTPYNCKNTAATTCISNCDATAMCGVDSLDGAQNCPMNICCSYFGYCGVSLPLIGYCSTLTELLPDFKCLLPGPRRRWSSYNTLPERIWQLYSYSSP